MPAVGKQVRKQGLLLSQLDPISFATWQRQLCDDWFSNDTAFMEYIVKRKIVMPEHLEDNLTVRPSQSSVDVASQTHTRSAQPKVAAQTVAWKLTELMAT